MMQSSRGTLQMDFTLWSIRECPARAIAISRTRPAAAKCQYTITIEPSRSSDESNRLHCSLARCTG